LARCLSAGTPTGNSKFLKYIFCEIKTRPVWVLLKSFCPISATYWHTKLHQRLKNLEIKKIGRELGVRVGFKQCSKGLKANFRLIGELYLVGGSQMFLD
jgi:hypothetical protein